MTDAIGQALYVPWQEAVIERIERQTARVKSFFVRPREWRSFRAGQHLDVQLTAPDGYQVQRSYSVASAPVLEGLYEIDVERLDDGEVSPSSTMLPRSATLLRSAPVRRLLRVEP